MGKCEIIELTTKLFFRTPIKERRFYNEARIKNQKKKSQGTPYSLFYINSMRKASEEFNSEIMINNILNCKFKFHPSMEFNLASLHVCKKAL